MDESGAVRVIFTVDTFTRASLGGGLVRHVGYAAELQKRGVEFVWLTIESDVDEEFQKRFAIRVRVVPMSGSIPVHQKRQILLHEAFRLAADLPSGSCVVSTDSCGISWNTTLQVWRARLRGIPSTHNTSMMPGPLPTTIFGKLRLKTVGRAFFNGLAQLIPQTRSIERFFRSYLNVSPARIKVIGNGVNCVRFSPADAKTKLAARQRLGLPAEASVVLSVGSLVPRKGMDLLIRAWGTVLKVLPNAHFAIAGSVGRRSTFMDAAATLDSYTTDTLRLIENLPDPKSIVLSACEVENVLDYYHAADVFVFASEREGLPNVVLEAMACGLPCLLSPYEGFPENGEELGVEGRHFLKCERKEGAFADGLVRLIGDASLRASLGDAARDLMLQTQNLDTILDQWAAMYHRIAKNQ